MAGNDANTTFLLPCTGSDGSTSFTNTAVGGNTHSITANGNAQVDTDVDSPFTDGLGSALFDGASDYLTSPDDTDWDLTASADWTIDFWIRRNGSQATNDAILQRGQAGSPYNGWTIKFESNAVAIRNNANGSGGVGGASLSDATWTHIAIVHDDTANTLTIYKDGTQVQQATASTAINWTNTSDALYIGSQNGFVGSRDFAGHLCEIRFSDTARWTSNFTPPTERYSPSYYSQALRGAAVVRNAFAPEARGAHKVVFADFAGVARGASAVFAALDQTARGAHAVTADFSGVARGAHTVYMRAAPTARGASSVMIGIAGAARGLHRSAKDQDAYALYLGTDEEPDFDADPWETFSSLPHETGPLPIAPAGTTVFHHLVLRARNVHGLESGNVEATIIEVDDTGAAVAERPSAPDFSATPGAAGTINVTATYAYPADGTSAADTFAIWYTTDGSAPDPTDTADHTATAARIDGTARLAYTIPAQPAGTTVRVLVRTRRTAAGVDSTNTTDASVTAATAGPDATTGTAFLGAVGAHVES